MKRLRLAALLIGLSPAYAQGAVLASAKAAESLETDIPVTVGIEASLPSVAPSGLLGHWGVGNGGDWMRINFARAREYAANVVLRINPDSLSRIKNDSVKQWIFKNQKFLAADILQTEHVWVTEEKPTCAFTVPPGADGKIPTANPIQFSYPTCRQQLKCSGDTKPVDENAPINFLEVAQLLIHEAAHHFNADETTADLIAIGIIDAWQSGLMDSIPLGLENAPVGTFKHSALWTGNRMIVVGGEDVNAIDQNKVSSYNPATGKWTDLGAPAWFTPRKMANLVWTGTHVLIWGGFYRSGGTTKWNFDGALYKPNAENPDAVGVWTKVEKPDFWTVKQPLYVDYPTQTMIWTGEKAVIWGGFDTTGGNLGAIFDPSADKPWTAMNTVGTTVGTKLNLAPVTASGHSAIWTGNTMIVWGGTTNGRTLSSEGSIYDLKTNTWKSISSGPSVGSPTGRAGHKAIWTGSAMVIISGGGSGTTTDLTSTGGLYYTATDTWTSFTSEPMTERIGHNVIWNGEEMLLIGGQSVRLKTYFGEVYAFNPATLRWRILTGSAAPVRRSYASIVWTGSSALVWGGSDSVTVNTIPQIIMQRSGSRYFP